MRAKLKKMRIKGIRDDKTKTDNLIGIQLASTTIQTDIMLDNCSSHVVLLEAGTSNSNE